MMLLMDSYLRVLYDHFECPVVSDRLVEKTLCGRVQAGASGNCVFELSQKRVAFYLSTNLQS